MALDISFIDRSGKPEGVHDHPEFDYCIYVACKYPGLDPDIAQITDANILARMLTAFSDGMNDTQRELREAYDKLCEATFGGEVEVENGSAYVIFWAKSREDAMMAKLIID